MALWAMLYFINNGLSCWVLETSLSRRGCGRRLVFLLYVTFLIALTDFIVMSQGAASVLPICSALLKYVTFKNADNASFNPKHLLKNALKQHHSLCNLTVPSGGGNATRATAPGEIRPQGAPQVVGSSVYKYSM